MKRSFALLTRLFVLVVLLIASVPTGATEAICVVGAEKREVEMGRCGMPCCTEKAAKRECCPADRTATPEAAPRLCAMASMDCRCETRLIGAPARTVAFANKAKSSDSPAQPTVLHNIRLEIPTPTHLIVEPGIRGVDSGPPRKIARRSEQTRGPPSSCRS